MLFRSGCFVLLLSLAGVAQAQTAPSASRPDSLRPKDTISFGSTDLTPPAQEEERQRVAAEEAATKKAAARKRARPAAPRKKL